MDCKEKLEEAKRLYKFSNDDQRYVLEDLFPELKKKEDEDEKIRIAILNYLRKMWANCKDNVCGVHIEDAIAWLEKQGDQKLANKIEPKFKVGDFIANDYCFGKVVALTNDAYLLDTEQGIPFSCEHNTHLWTIQDAKDGDILVSKYNAPFIYNGNYDLSYVGSYCGISSDDRFIVSTKKCFWTENANIHPVTKEQRNLLFKKMKEAGYEWDAEKLELKEIEQKPIWSNRDENYIISAIELIMHCTWKSYRGLYKEDVVEWLKSFKYRFAENKEEFEE